jgi:hypothetical protein
MLSSTTAIPSQQMTIVGRGFGATQGSGAVQLGTANAAVLSWTDTQIVAIVAQSTQTGVAQVFQVGLASNQIGLTIVAPDTLTATASPAANSNGWNNSNVTVTFACTTSGQPIPNCLSPQTVATEGAGQVVTGAVTGSGGTQLTTSVTFNIDRTIPILAVISPADGTGFTTAGVTLSGTVSDALSGLSSVTCNGAAAVVSSGSFSCNISLNLGVNLVVVRATDVAGNVAASNTHLTLVGTLPAPQSLQISPATLNMLVGDTHKFSAVDELGRPRTDATWTISDTTLATISTDSSPLLTAVAIGQVTLTANVQGTSAQAQVNILSGSALALGTVSWSVPGVVCEYIVQAVPTDQGTPDFYCFNGGFVIAYSSDGRQMWQNSTFSGLSSAKPISDAFGGLAFFVTAPDHLSTPLTDLDGRTGQLKWQNPSLSSDSIAVGQDGTFYGVCNITDCSDFEIVGIDGQTGTQRIHIPLPLAPSVPGPSFSNTYIGPLAVDVDGSLVFEHQIHVVDNGGASHLNATISLYRVQPDGTVSTQFLTSYDMDIACSWGCPIPSPSRAVPDGQGGLVTLWNPAAASTTVNRNTMGAHVTSSGASPYELPVQGVQDDGIVLGENGTAFVTGTVYPPFGSNAPPLLTTVSYDVNSGQVAWTNQSYQSSSQFTLNFLGVTPGNGVVVKTTDSNGADTLTGLDPSGNSTSSATTGTGTSYSWKGQWNAIANGALSGLALPSIPLTWASAWAEPGGNSSGTGQAVIRHSIGLFWCGTGYGQQGSCTQDPFNVGGDDIAFGYATDLTANNPNELQTPQNNFANSHHDWVDLIEAEAMKALQTAFAKFPGISVQVASQGDKSCYWLFTCHHERLQEHTAFVVGDWGDQGQTGVLIDLASSRVYFPPILDSAETAVSQLGQLGRPNYPPSAQDLPAFLNVLKAAGRGVGNTAAHEIGHQLQADVPLPDMNCGNDTSNPDKHPCEGNYNFVYNFFNGSGYSQDPSNPDGIGAQFKYVDVPGISPIHWGSKICKSLADYANPGSSGRTDCPLK